MEDMWTAVDYIAAQEPERTRPGSGWPCSVFVALVTRRAMDLDTHPDFLPGSEWWRAVNIWEGHSRLSPMRAYASMAQGGTWRENLSPYDAADVIRGSTARWFVVQGWRTSGTGHQFLVEKPEGTHADHYRIVESSELHGLRVNERAWPTNDYKGYGFRGLLARLESFDSVLGVTPLIEAETPRNPILEAAMADITIPKEVSEEALEELKEKAGKTLADTLEELAIASDDGKLEAEEAAAVATALVEGVIDGVIGVLDVVTPLPEPVESLSDIALNEAREYLRSEAGPLEALADAVVDVLDGPEVEDILRKLYKHAARHHIEGKRGAARKERKHAWRLLQKFPAAAAALGIEGESRSTLVLGYSVGRTESGDVVLLPL